MKLGNASWGFRETPLEEQLKITADMGLKLLELGIANAPMDLPLDITDEKIENVKQLFKKYGVELSCAATGNDFSCGSRDDVEKIKKVTDICEKLGVKYLRIFAGFSPVSEVTDSRWEIMNECLFETAVYAKEHGVNLVIETHGGVDAYDDGVVHFNTVTTNADTLLEIIGALPENVGINYDPANLYAAGTKRPEEFYEKIKGRTCYMHLKDFVTLPSGHLLPASCGESGMDWKAILKPMKDFDGPALFEYENTGDVKEGCERCLNYINKILKEI